MQNRSIECLASVCLLLAMLSWPGSSRAQLYTYNLSLPPEDGQYVSPDEWHAYYGMGIYIKDVVHSGFTASYPPPPPGPPQIETFGSRIDLVASMDGGVTWHSFWGSGPVAVRIQNAGGGNYTTEMTSMTISGGSLPDGIMVRESPTLASTGETSITDEGGGLYKIDSFFDVFTELSLDGGMSWLPDETGPHSARPCLTLGTVVVRSYSLIGIDFWIRFHHNADRRGTCADDYARAEFRDDEP